MASDLSSALRNLTLTERDENIFYLQQLATVKNTYFPVKWGGIALKNCDDKGELLNFKSKNEASKSVIRPWIYLPLKIFIIEEELYPVWCCPQCQEMKGIMSLQPAQSAMAIKRIQCIHSQALSHLIHDWRNLWNINGISVSALHENDETIQ